MGADEFSRRFHVSYPDGSIILPTDAVECAQCRLVTQLSDHCETRADAERFGLRLVADAIVTAHRWTLREQENRPESKAIRAVDDFEQTGR
jgi:hypothetical protein